jgi:hypothetical protein
MPVKLAERRIHRVYVTSNTEYHLRRDLCVAVRDRKSGRFLTRHAALFRRVRGAMRRYGDNGCVIEDALPREGQSLVFETAVTTPVLSIERPHPALVRAYPPFRAPRRPRLSANTRE